MDVELRKTLPDILETVFMCFRGNLPKTDAENVSIYDVWKKTFEGASIRQSEMYTRIGQILDMLEETLAQVEVSSNLSEARKLRARSVVSLFIPTVTLFKLHLNGWSVVHNCSIENCGSLGLLSDALRSRFSENVFTQTDVSDILEVLQTVRALLDDVALPLRLRINLQRQIDSLIWRLQHPEFESLQQATDALGRATLSANYLERLSPDEASREKSGDVRDKLITCLTKAVGVMERGSKVVVAGKLLHDTIKPLLGSGP